MIAGCRDAADASCGWYGRRNRLFRHGAFRHGAAWRGPVQRSVQRGPVQHGPYSSVRCNTACLGLSWQEPAGWSCGAVRSRNRTRHGRRCPCFHAKQGHLSTLLWSRQPGRFGRSDRGCLPFRNLSPAPPCGVSCGRSAGCVGVGYFIRSTYSRVRVSTRILSPVLMKSGTRIVAPVLTVAGLSELVEAVSPLIPGSV